MKVAGVLRAVAGLFVAGPAAAALAQPFPPEPPDRRRNLGGWLVEHVGEEDGGRIVRMSRERDGIRLEYDAVFWRGNYGIYMHSAAKRPGLSCGTDQWRQAWGTTVPAEAVRARLAAHLADCGTAPAQVAAALQGFEPAFRLAARWVRQAEALTAAEIQAIVDYGAGDSD